MKRVFVPGWLGTARDFAALGAAAHEVHEIPGLGARRGEELASIEGYAQDLLERSAAGSMLCAYSMGARIALLAACRAPEHFAALLLCGVHPGLASEEQRAARRQLDEERSAALLRDPEAFLEDWFGLPLFAPLRRCTSFAALAERRREELLQAGAAESAGKTLRACSLAEQPELLNELEGLAPTLLVNGSLDEKFCRQAQRMSERAADKIRSVQIANCGHALLSEAPRELTRLFAELC